MHGKHQRPGHGGARSANDGNGAAVFAGQFVWGWLHMVSIPAEVRVCIKMYHDLYMQHNYLTGHLFLCYMHVGPALHPPGGAET